MKFEKLSLSSVKNVLSRAELRKIMAGSGGAPPPIGGGGTGGSGGLPGSDHGTGCYIYKLPNLSQGCQSGICNPDGYGSHHGTCE